MRSRCGSDTENFSKLLNSIAYQLEKITEYCLKNNIDIVARFVDEALSGTNINRDGFLDLIQSAQRGEFDCVVIYDVTRGSRDVADWFAFRKKMYELNIKVISVEDNLGDIMNANDFLRELLTVGLGQHHVLTTRAKSMDGIYVKAKQGEFLGGVPPLGYDVKDGKYIIKEEEAAVVRKIFDLYVKGYSYGMILKEIGEVIGKRGKPLKENSLYYTLRNERYVGTYTWNKRIIKQMGKWAGGKPNPNAVIIRDLIPPIIDFDTWMEAKKRMESKKRTQTRQKYQYLLSGLIECEACGANFIGSHSKNKKGYVTRYYICNNLYNKDKKCNAKRINADLLEGYVISCIRDYFDRADLQEDAKLIADTLNAASSNLDKEKKELAKIEQQLKNGTKAILNGANFEELRDEMDKLRARKSVLEDIIYRNARNSKKADAENIYNVLKEASENIDKNIQNVVKTLITKIYAHNDGSITINVGASVTGCGGGI